MNPIIPTRLFPQMDISLHPNCIGLTAVGLVRPVDITDTRAVPLPSASGASCNIQLGGIVDSAHLTP